MTFSVRNRYAPPKPVQLESMDSKLQNAIWNLHVELFDELYSESSHYHSRENHFYQFLLAYWQLYFSEPIDVFQAFNNHQRRLEIRRKFFVFNWHEVYSFVEFTARTLEYFWPKLQIKFRENFNTETERENSPYRLVDNFVVPLVLKEEIQAIESALTVGSMTEKHLKNALKFLSDKEYRKCCEEAILAVEAYSREIAGNESAILSELCKKKKLPVPKTLLDSLEKFYAWTSDEIRHAEKKDSKEITVSIALSTLNISANFINLIKDYANNNLELTP